MKAMVCTTYGPAEVLQIREVPKPVPKRNELRVRVRATSIGYGDLTIRNFKSVSPRDFNMPFLFWVMAKLYSGIRRPRTAILGSEFSGVVDAVGNAVTTFKPGDEVFGYLGQQMGADAEYLCIAADGCVAPKPANMTFDEAAVAPYGTIMAWDLLRKAGIQAGQKVLILGASGGIGSAAVQLARHHFGAEVTGVCSTPRVELVRSLGANKVIDYTREDFTRSGEKYDLIFDVLGKGSFARCKGVLAQNGRYLLASFKGKQLLQMFWTAVTRQDQRVICAIAPGNGVALRSVKELIERGKLKAHIDQRFPLEKLAAAHRYAESGQQRGKIVISLDLDQARSGDRPAESAHHLV